MRVYWKFEQREMIWIRTSQSSDFQNLETRKSGIFAPMDSLLPANIKADATD